MEQFIGEINKDHFGSWDDCNPGLYLDSLKLDDELFHKYLGKKVKLTIEVLPDDIKKDDSIKVQVQLRKIVQIDKLCDALGINPYCINEGADGDNLVNVPVELVKRFGLI